MLELFVSLQTLVGVRKASIEEHGATGVQYAAGVGLFALAMIGAFWLFDRDERTAFNITANTLPA